MNHQSKVICERTQSLSGQENAAQNCKRIETPTPNPLSKSTMSL